jgi:DNA-binding NtrC family response regulator
MMFAGRRIAVVEDDGIMGASIVQRLELEGARVTWLRQLFRAVGELRTPRQAFDAVVCDIRLPDGTGEELFKVLSETAVPPPFLFVTGQGGIDQAVRLLRSGASDYITKPFDMGQFLTRLARILPPARETAGNSFFGVSPAARRIEAAVEAAALEDKPVLIRGAAGTGKKAASRHIHQLSARHLAAFTEVNFARTEDAQDALKKAWSTAAGGTVFLNAIDWMDAAVQDLLMGLLDEDCGHQIVSASSPQIGDLVASGSFRADLFFRLAQIEIDLPQFDERPDDAVWLLENLFKELNGRRTSPLRGISELALEAAKSHHWHGNGRELRSRLVRAMDVATGEWVFPVDLFPERQIEPGFQSLADARVAAERTHIVAALERVGGQMSEAARLLGISRTTLWEKMQKLGI